MKMHTQDLSLQNVSFGFKKNGPLFFKSINISMEAGKLHFVQGSNGSGKSTLFRVIQGAVQLTEYIDGLYMLNGVVYSSVKQVALDRYSMQVKQVIQNVQQMLIAQMTVAENIAFTRMRRFPFLHTFSTKKVEDSFLQKANIMLNQPVYTLSGGQKQLLAIVMSAHNAGQVLLLDEPTAALDDVNTELVMNNLTMLAQERNIIVIIICHDTDIVKKYCSGKLITIKKEADQVTRVITIT